MMTNSVVMRNYEYGRMMAKMECWAHAIDLPVDVSLAKILRNGALQALQKPNTRKALSPAEVEQKMLDAKSNKKGFSYISLGDTECGFLCLDQRVAEPYFKFGNQDFYYAGYDPSREEEERNDLLEAIRKADVVGIPIYRHGLIQAPLLHFLSEKGVDLEKVVWADSTVNYKLMVSGALKRLLTAGAPLVLCIGNEAQRLANYLVRQGVIVSGVLTPVRGMKEFASIVEKASRISYDIALVAAGAASVPICSALAHTQQKVALDIGKVADEWVTGISSFEGKQQEEGLLHSDVFSQEQKAFSLEIQTGYQHGLNELIPDDIPLPLGSFPHHWLRSEWLTRQGKAGEEQNRSIKSPLWLIQKLNEAIRQSSPLSFVTVDAGRLQQLAHPDRAADPELTSSLSRIDLIGIPYLLEHQVAVDVVDDNRWKPRLGWVDTTALEQLQFEYYGGFLPEWLMGKRLLLVMANPQAPAYFLKTHGYTIWGTICSTSGRNQVLSELANAGSFDVALVSAGVETFIYNQFIARQLGKIALDVGNILEDAPRAVINTVFWANGRINKID